MKKDNWIATTVFCSMLCVIGLWAIDVSASAMAANGRLIGIGGFADPAFVYHVGILLVLLSFFFVAMIAVHHVLKLVEIVGQPKGRIVLIRNPDGTTQVALLETYGYSVGGKGIINKP